MVKLRWLLQPESTEAPRKLLEEKLKIDSVTASVLVRRGVKTYEDARKYFACEWQDLHDPFLMQDMAIATERILLAIRNKERILVYGDFDVDGTTSVALTTLAFDMLGVSYEYHIPDRYVEGYGLSYIGIDFGLSKGCTLMICLDCGTRAHTHIEYASQNGMDVIVCDHHLPDTTLPPVVAMLNPKRKDCAYPYKELTGCGIGFKLLCALWSKLNRNDYIWEHFADLVTLSIACDLVPITDENRTIAFYGLKKIQNNPLPGVAALKNLASNQRAWEISDLVFFMGPRINAAGRISHARHAVEVLRGKKESLEQDTSLLEDSNETRRILENEIYNECVDIIEQSPHLLGNASIVLWRAHWKKGVIGIVASKLIERYYKPTIMLTMADNKWVGSCRSVHEFDIHEAINRCSTFVVQFGGHKYAAGLTVTEENMNSFAEAFENICQREIRFDQTLPILPIEAIIDFSQITDKFFRLQQRMSPFGPENMIPLYQTNSVVLLNYRIIKEKHLKLTLRQGKIIMEGIAFGMAERTTELETAKSVAIVYSLELNTLQNRNIIQLRIRDFRAHA
ncbi:MAG: single-stranded-DNA-specific exonuclease RecJ [Bacteroidia bacterium]|nr:single-stranded-DNA-specific exonuclease RecJ [Bacteroidia bacterium]